MMLNVNEPETRGMALALQTMLDDLGKGTLLAFGVFCLVLHICFAASPGVSCLGIFNSLKMWILLRGSLATCL